MRSASTNCLADVALLVRALVAAAAADGAGVEHDRHAAVSFRQATMCWTQPQSALDDGRDAALEALEGVVLVGRWRRTSGSTSGWRSRRSNRRRLPSRFVKAGGAWCRPGRSRPPCRG